MEKELSLNFNMKEPAANDTIVIINKFINYFINAGYKVNLTGVVTAGQEQ